MIRINEKVINSYKTVLGYGGTLLIVFGAALMLPITACIFYPEEVNQIIYFLVPSLVCISIGLIIRHLFRHARENQLTFRQDSILVVLTWVIAALISSIPIMLSLDMPFTLAFFEMVSGWTSTGLSVFDVAATPKIFLLHRSMTEFFGGVGIVLVMLSVLSTGFGVKLFTAEGNMERILPNLGKSARVILAIYSGYAIGGTILYIIAGMPVFDAINHAMTAISTGGFSTHPLGISAYEAGNNMVYFVTIILMLLGSLGFGTHILLLRGRFKRLFKLTELRLFLLMIAVAIPLVAFFGLSQFYNSTGEAFRVGFFEVVSAISTTGFQYSPIAQWPAFPLLMITLLMLIGGSLGSTSGGMKIYRILIMCKNAIWNIGRYLKPDRMVNENYIWRPEGKVYINHKLVSQSASYIFAFVTFYLVGLFIFMSQGYGFQESMFEFASAIGTSGLTLGITSPTAPPIILWTEIAGMLLGRLEIYVIFVAVLKIAKDAKNLLVFKKE